MPQSDVNGRHFGILQLGDSLHVSMDNLCENKVNCDLLFLLHVNDDDRYGSFDNTYTK